MAVAGPYQVDAQQIFVPGSKADQVVQS